MNYCDYDFIENNIYIYLSFYVYIFGFNKRYEIVVKNPN